MNEMGYQRVNPVRMFRWMATLVLTVALGAGQSAAAAEEKNAEAPPGSIEFIGKNGMMTAKGKFHKWKLTKVQVDRENPEKSVIVLEIDLASIDTKIVRRDNHLRTPDFFDIAKYPTATLTIRDARLKEKKPDGTAVYVGKIDFNLHGVEKTLDLAFEIAGEARLKVTGKIVLSRTDFGIGAPYSKFNPMSVEDEIRITFTVTLPEKL